MSPNEDNLSETLLDQNYTRFAFVPFIAVPVHVGHILLFGRSLGETGSIERTWALGIIAAHAAFASLALLLGALGHLRRRRGWPHGRLGWWLVDGLVLAFLLGGVAIVVLDQWVTTAITPFLVVCILAGVVVLQRPSHAFLVFSAAYGAFFFLLPVTQTDASVLLSNRMNGLTVAAGGFLLSALLWRNSRARFLQELVIAAQQAELTASNRELRQRSEELRELNATKDKLFSVIAHDLKNPFQSIIGLSEILRDEAGASPADIENYAETIRDAAVQTHELLDNLLHWARLQQGALPCVRRRLPLSDLVDDAIRLLQASARRKQIRLVHTVPAGLAVDGDAVMLQTVLRNLLSNAVKFTARGGMVSLTTDVEAGQVRIDVVDSGVGIPAENLARLQRGEMNLSTAGTAAETGTGIGLVLCREFIERHEGRLEIESTPGRGSRFRVVLPAPETSARSHPDSGMAPASDRDVA